MMPLDRAEICPAMIDQGAQALADRIGKLDAVVFRAAAEAVLRAALASIDTSDKPSPGDRTRTGQTAGGEGCDLAPPLSNNPILWIAKDRLDRIAAGQEEPWVYTADQSHLFECVPLFSHPAPSTHLRVTDEMVERAAAAYWLEVYGRHRKSRQWPEDVHGGSEQLFRDGCRAALNAALSTTEEQS